MMTFFLLSSDPRQAVAGHIMFRYDFPFLSKFMNHKLIYPSIIRNLHADDKAFQDWCQDQKQTEMINKVLYRLYARSVHHHNENLIEPEMTEVDAEVTEGG